MLQTVLNTSKKKSKTVTNKREHPLKVGTDIGNVPSCKVVYLDETNKALVRSLITIHYFLHWLYTTTIDFADVV
jgi:hypothetical protein